VGRPVPSQLWTIKRVAGTNPAANTEISDAVPTGKTWEILCVSIPLVQGATQTPQPILIIDDGTTTLYEMFGSSAAQAVSTTCVYNWGPDLSLTGQIGATTNVHSNAPLPSGLYLPAGYRIRTNTLGIGANSDYGAPSYFVIEYG
jgi:hypothetical protein